MPFGRLPRFGYPSGAFAGGVPSSRDSASFREMRQILLSISLVLFGCVALFAATPSLSLRAKVEPSAERYYTGQRIRIVLEAEADGAEISGIQFFGLPDPEWAQKVAEAELEGDRGVRAGETFHLRRWTVDYLILSPGNFVFQPHMRARLQTRSQRGTGPAFVFSSSIERPASATGHPFPMKVFAPPSPSPADFSGLVGDFRLEAGLVPDVASPGDLVNLRWSLVGLGNFSDFHPPAVDVEAGLFRAYAPKFEAPADVRDRMDITQVFVPLTPASTNLPPLAVTIFDPVAGAYRTLRAGPFSLDLVERKTDDESAYLPHVEGGGVFVAGQAGKGSVGEMDADGGDVSPGILNAPAMGRLAPSASSLKIRTLPAGSPVELLERSGSWMRVASPGGPSAWIPASAIGSGAAFEQ